VDGEYQLYAELDVVVLRLKCELYGIECDELLEGGVDLQEDGTWLIRVDLHLLAIHDLYAIIGALHSIDAGVLQCNANIPEVDEVEQVVQPNIRTHDMLFQYGEEVGCGCRLGGSYESGGEHQLSYASLPIQWNQLQGS
jgi:hypothetical protein